MPSGVICCYGCDNFTIENVNSDGDILLMAGVIAAQYVVPSANFAVKHVNIRSGNIITEMGGRDSYAKFTNVVLNNGKVELFGAVKNLTMADVAIVGGKGAQLTEAAEFLTGNLKNFMPEKQNRVIRRVTLSP
jgi:predicted phosphohydrolase